MRVAATVRVDVTTCGHPAEALAAAALRLTGGRPYVLKVGVSHDDGCPCLAGEAMAACTCEIVQLEAKRVA